MLPFCQQHTELFHVTSQMPPPRNPDPTPQERKKAKARPKPVAKKDKTSSKGPGPDETLASVAPEPSPAEEKVVHGATKKYTSTQLQALSRSDIVKFATELGLEVTKRETKKALLKRILEAEL